MAHSPSIISFPELDIKWLFGYKTNCQMEPKVSMFGNLNSISVVRIYLGQRYLILYKIEHVVL